MRKKAYDLWKDRVYNTNKQLRVIYRDILDFVRFAWLGTFGDTPQAVPAEMAVKYTPFLEQFIKEDGEFDEMVMGISSSARIRSLIKDESDGLLIDLRNYSEALVCSKLRNEPDLLAVKEFIILETIKANNLIETAYEFCIENSSIPVFVSLFNIPSLRQKLLNEMYRNCEGKGHFR